MLQKMVASEKVEEYIQRSSVKKMEMALREFVKLWNATNLKSCSRGNQAYEKHVSRCEEDGSRRKGDAIDQDLEMAHDMVYKDQTSGVYTRHTLKLELAEIPFDEASDYKTMQRG